MQKIESRLRLVGVSIVMVLFSAPSALAAQCMAGPSEKLSMASESYLEFSDDFLLEDDQSEPGQFAYATRDVLYQDKTFMEKLAVHAKKLGLACFFAYCTMREQVKKILVR